jgi:hypothetical protein
MDFNNFKVYFTKTLQSVSQIIEEVTTIFLECGFTSVKIQLRFGVIWEGLTLEARNMEFISEYTSTYSLSLSSSYLLQL